MERKKRPTKAKLGQAGPSAIPKVLETWEAYHSAILELIEEGAAEAILEENRDMASFYYEAYLDLMILHQKKT